MTAQVPESKDLPKLSLVSTDIVHHRTTVQIVEFVTSSGRYWTIRSRSSLSSAGEISSNRPRDSNVQDTVGGCDDTAKLLNCIGRRERKDPPRAQTWDISTRF